MQLGFDRQHFTLPVPAIFFELNKGLPARQRDVSTNPGLAMDSYFELLELPDVQGRRLQRPLYALGGKHCAACSGYTGGAKGLKIADRQVKPDDK
ncbi:MULTISPECIES: hypothetical protein [Pseudomonas syringae group]|nr:hypothetical protein [Pseudomonas viridiflava]MCF8979015.1 hypothetical protein [Pseudomonas syringae]QXG33182.1 hypothetical protein KTT59_06340 [Pseudomonas viridiflava]